MEDKKSRIVIYVPIETHKRLQKKAQEESIAVSSLLKVAINTRLREGEPDRKLGYVVDNRDNTGAMIWVSAVSPSLMRDIRVYCKDNEYSSMQEFFRSIINEDIL